MSACLLTPLFPLLTIASPPWPLDGMVVLVMVLVRVWAVSVMPTLLLLLPMAAAAPVAGWAGEECDDDDDDEEESNEENDEEAGWPAPPEGMPDMPLFAAGFRIPQRALMCMREKMKESNTRVCVCAAISTED